jgi:hypothetical protein
MSEGENEELTEYLGALLVADRQAPHALQVCENMLHDDSLRI